jgi:hypothetical protein
MIGSLSAGLVAAFSAGDLEAARIANEAIGRLLGPATADAGTVPELPAARRAER